MEKGIGNEEYIINTIGEITEEWKEATQKAHDMREELRVPFGLKNSYGELRNQLGEWEEDKQWKAREESNRRSNAEREIYPQFLKWGDLEISITQFPTISEISARKMKREI